MKHLDDHDLERYYLGMVRESELTDVELHLLWCHNCVRQAEIVEDYINAMRVAIIHENFDLERLERGRARHRKISVLQS